MQLVSYLERAHVASAAFRREFDRVLGAANPFQCVVGDRYESHYRNSMIPNQLLPSSIQPRRQAHHLLSIISFQASSTLSLGGPLYGDSPLKEPLNRQTS